MCFGLYCWMWNLQIQNSQQALHAVRYVRWPLSSKLFGHRDQSKIELVGIVIVHFVWILKLFGFQMLTSQYS